MIQNGSPIQERSFDLNEINGREADEEAAKAPAALANEESEKVPEQVNNEEVSDTNSEQKKLNSLLYGEEEDINMSAIDNFSLEEVTGDIGELEQPHDPQTVRATAVGTAIVTTASYLLFKFISKKK